MPYEICENTQKVPSVLLLLYYCVVTHYFNRQGQNICKNSGYRYYSEILSVLNYSPIIKITPYT